MKFTIMNIMQKTAEKFGNSVALRSKTNGEWKETDWKDYYYQTRLTARAFISLGLEKGKSVCILGNNRPEWFISDLAAIFAGGLASGIYTTSSPEQCQYIAEHSDAHIVVVENKEQLAKFKTVWNQLPLLKAIVMMAGSDEDSRVYSWENLAELAENISEETLEKKIKAQSPDDCCSLIYTSGTTGHPKGVMLTHDNAMWTARQIAKTVNAKDTDQLISYLPLSHILEQVCTLYLPIIAGCCTSFAESLDKLGENLVEVKPTFFVGVPRVWEKIQTKITQAGMQTSGIQKQIVGWAKNKGKAGGYAEQEGKSKPLFYGVADKLVFSKVRGKLGFDNCRMFISTAAPVSIDTLEFFLSLGIPVTEAYGMSECTGPATISMPVPHKYRTGWAGPVLQEAEISTAEDGEILMRGRHVFKGYYKNEKATQETIDTDGWLYSGDIGEIDDKGFLKITDRKKEIIITSAGENIAPQVLEGKFKAIPALSQVAVIGNQRKYLAALFTLAPEAVKQESKSAGSPAQNSADAAKCEKFKKYLSKQVNEINSSLARVQTIKKFTILPEEFSIDSGELTHTMKLKRRVLLKKYAEEIENMYSD